MIRAPPADPVPASPPPRARRFADGAAFVDLAAVRGRIEEQKGERVDLPRGGDWGVARRRPPASQERPVYHVTCAAAIPSRDSSRRRHLRGPALLLIQLG